MDGVGGFSCECNPGFIGEYCDETDHCFGVTCSETGTVRIHLKRSHTHVSVTRALMEMYVKKRVSLYVRYFSTEDRYRFLKLLPHFLISVGLINSF